MLSFVFEFGINLSGVLLALITVINTYLIMRNRSAASDVARKVGSEVVQKVEDKTAELSSKVDDSMQSIQNVQTKVDTVMEHTQELKTNGGNSVKDQLNTLVPPRNTKD